MIVRIFHAGTSRGESPVRYLLSDVDHQGEERAIQPEVLEGHPDTTIQIINSISRKHKYVSGVIAFRDEEQPSREQMYQVMDAFKATVLPGLSPDQYNNLWVLHREKGNTELHFVVPMQEMTTGRRLNIHPPGPKNIELYQAFTQVMNQSLGYGQVLSDPLKVPLTDFERKAPTGADSKRNANQLHSEIRQAIRSGAVNNRDQLCQFLDETLGVTITRKGANYLSVKLPGQAKAIRLKGELFEEGGDYQTLLAAKSEKPGLVMLTSPEFSRAQARLAVLVQERHDFNQAAYRTRSDRMAAPRIVPPPAKAWTVPLPKPTPAATATGLPTPQLTPRLTTGGPMTKKTNETKQTKKPSQIIEEAMILAKQVEAQVRQPKPITDKARITATISRMREETFNPKRANSVAALKTITDIEAAIAQLQLTIDGAVTDELSAMDPAEKAKAEVRVRQLMEQMYRLQRELAKAKEGLTGASVIKPRI